MSWIDVIRIPVFMGLIVFFIYFGLSIADYLIEKIKNKR